MDILEGINGALSGAILPVILLIAGIYIGYKVRFFYLLHPIRFYKDIKDSAKSGGVSPFRALTVALAGTLGVGNITGVATAIYAGGAGAIFWMWVCAFVVMSVKYAEVYLSQRHKRRDSGGHFFGGAMYYMEEGLSPLVGKKFATGTASVFALLISMSALLTGCTVQVDAAAGVFTDIAAGVPPILCGAVFAVFAAICAAGGLKRVSDLTVRLIPLLTGIYMVVSVAVIIIARSALPDAFRAIFKGAFTPAAAGGGVLGFGLNSAIRFGTTRGIFSNEAGCGTAPSAHAAANAKSPHHQGCFGVFEVFADTIVLCTLTALVILTSGVMPTENGIVTALSSFAAVGGRFSSLVIGVSAVLFAFATVVCQSFYGLGAVRYLFPKGRIHTLSKRLYICLIAAACLAGAVISSTLMWQLADLFIGLMTVINSIAVFVIFRRERRGETPFFS